ncbi:hypothetical protein J27TS7_02970 [Paenibacillus dendritiformis]|uniref:hypothetical protein n=1 Tax=Paenibacillus dendritiformis TaxID=130049 RepID=UPI00143D58F2|nr:hypothetical protein [Paenibacillus dendritiformis]NKI19809.1 hypothetical protein [Paenibacillus dendritiformis]NRF99927.1 hypothetical protein [Paenibacillus dendritiformis]GIO70783.1 hypothetical protein J27TS7_02970 [Paenibacillus dendritiformis]
MKTMDMVTKQRYTQLLAKAARTLELLAEVLEVDADEYQDAECDAVMIRSAITLCEVNPTRGYLDDLERDIARGLGYVRFVRRIWRKRSRAREVYGYEIGYYRNCRTGNYEVSWIDPVKSSFDKSRVKRAVFLPGVIHSIAPQTLADEVAGVVTVTYDQMLKLGFIIEQVSAA